MFKRLSKPPGSNGPVSPDQLEELVEQQVPRPSRPATKKGRGSPDASTTELKDHDEDESEEHGKSLNITTTMGVLKSARFHQQAQHSNTEL